MMQSQTPERKRSRCRFPRIRLWKSPRTLTASRDKSFTYSKPLEDVYPRPTKSFTILPCRVPLKDHAVRAAVHRLYNDEDMTQIISKDKLDSSVTNTDSPIGRYSALLFPECLPDRLETVAFIIEAGFLYDDVMDDGSCAAMKDDMAKAVMFAAGASSRKIAIQKWIAKNLLELVNLYGKEGRVLLHGCQAGWLDMCTTDAEKRPTIFEDYISQRIRNFALPALWTVTAFSLGVLLTAEESELVQPLTDMANRIVVQTNDYFSWEVEGSHEKDRIFNAVLCLMGEHHISEEQAKARLKSYIIHDEVMYQSMLDCFYKTNPRLPSHLQKYIAAGLIFVGGNHHWSAICPRYNLPEASGRKQVPSTTVKMETMTADFEPKDFEIGQCTRNPGCEKNPTVQAINKTDLDITALLAAPRYIQSLPSKNIRSKLVDAFNIWFEIPEDRVSIIKGVIDDLHNATLILDDIQDGSILRRGSSAAHCIFGSAQCINSATYMVVQATARILEHHTKTPLAMGALLDGLVSLSIGQSWDLNWKFNSYCPSIKEYMAMVDGKTGAMFKLLVGLMRCMAPLRTWPVIDFDRFTQLLGRWYQVRDDFQNLQDPEYTEQKGFCEDLDEGKLSYPVVLCCNSDPVARDIILGIFRQDRNGTPLARSVKMQILDLLQKTGALKETWQIVQQLEKEVEDTLSALEIVLGEPNPSLRLITKLLSNISPPR